jgi:two-component system sensor histidine kinase PhoQ
LNLLIKNEHERQARYRNTLGNLAHSLKTPLAVMRNLLSAPSADTSASQEINTQVSRMDDIVRYQLKRAAAGATSLGTAPIDVLEQLQGLRGALLKVYADKDIDLRMQIAPGTTFTGDAGDLTEIAGNLLDNACKWCRGQVQLTAAPVATPASRREGLVLVVEDDGPGIPELQRDRVLQRGARLDEHVTGQGIGLSVVRELAEASGGSITVSTSSLGGARIEVKLVAL